MNWIEILGQKLLFDASGMQPIKRLLYFGTRRKANSHNSAFADIQPTYNFSRQCGV